MDLNKRLRRLRRDARLPQRAATQSADAIARARLQELVPGEWYDAGGCRCYVTNKRYPVDHVYGRVSLKDICSLSRDLWKPWLGQSAQASLDPRRALFIDAETTGLGTGPSTLAFMLGVAHYDAGEFVVRQYMIPDPADEPAMLDLLLADLEAHPGLVSFNGRSFDWPLIKTRLLLAGRLPESLGKAHLDLLLMARRLWKRRLSSCSLSSLETQVLGIERTAEDVPGWMIPGIYADFCAQGIVEPLAGVFYHNQLDMVSMAALAIVIGSQLSDPWRDPGPLHDYFALGRLCEHAGRIDEAKRAYRQAWERDGESRALVGLSTLLKREGDMAQAVQLWENALDCSGSYPYIELAKHYEHNEQDYRLAHAHAVSALCRLNDNSACADRDAIEHRIARLEHKLGLDSRPSPPQSVDRGSER